MTLIVDASVVVAALIDTSPVGVWAEGLIASEVLSAPHPMPVEVASTLRRAAAAGEISPDVASLAHADLIDMPVELFGYGPFAERAWELRNNVTSYDAWYVALAESLESRIATLDAKLARAAGPRCGFETPPGAQS